MKVNYLKPNVDEFETIYESISNIHSDKLGDRWHNIFMRPELVKKTLYRGY